MPEISALLEATRALADKVDHLGSSLQLSQQQVKRTKRLVTVVTVLAVISLIGVAATIVGFVQIHDSQVENKHSQVVGCKNANESRAANQALWDFILDASAAQRQQTPTTQDFIKQLKVYIADVYAQHDCNDLSKKYPLPDPPDIRQLG